MPSVKEVAFKIVTPDLTDIDVSKDLLVIDPAKVEVKVVIKAGKDQDFAKLSPKILRTLEKEAEDAISDYQKAIKKRLTDLKQDFIHLEKDGTPRELAQAENMAKNAVSFVKGEIEGLEGGIGQAVQLAIKKWGKIERCLEKAKVETKKFTRFKTIEIGAAIEEKAETSGMSEEEWREMRKTVKSISDELAENSEEEGKLRNAAVKAFETWAAKAKAGGEVTDLRAEAKDAIEEYGGVLETFAKDIDEVKKEVKKLGNRINLERNLDKRSQFKNAIREFETSAKELDGLVYDCNKLSEALAKALKAAPSPDETAKLKSQVAALDKKGTTAYITGRFQDAAKKITKLSKEVGG